MTKQPHLWRLTDKRFGYDTTHQYLIRAYTAQDARKVAVERTDSTFGDNKTRWLDPSKTTCEEILVTGKIDEVIVNDFRPG